jgi:hypothetical protein
MRLRAKRGEFFIFGERFDGLEADGWVVTITGSFEQAWDIGFFYQFLDIGGTKEWHEMLR